MSDKKCFVTALGRLVRNRHDAAGMSQSAVGKEAGLPGSLVPSAADEVAVGR